MKKAFSLLELIIVIVIISILTIFILQKSENSIDFGNKTKIKSEIALIRNAISKQKTSNILLNKSTVSSLDNANIEKKKSLLFKNILDLPLVSTTSSKKDIAKWIKTSQNEYKIFINENESLEFKFENESFICKSSISLCKEFE